MVGDGFHYLLGTFAGDGWFERRGIAIGTNNVLRANVLNNLMTRLFNKEPKYKLRIYKDGHSLYIIALYSVYVESLFRNALGNPKKDKSKNFKLPKYKDKSLLREFIKGIFEAEAYHYTWREQPRIAFEIYNMEACKEIFNHIKEDNIKCYFSRIKKGGYRIDITGDNNVSRFYKLYNVTFCRE